MSSALTSAKTTSYPALCRLSPTKPRPMLPAPKCTAFMAGSLIDRGQYFEHLLRRLGLQERLDLVLVAEDERDAGEHIHVSAVFACDADDEAHVVAGPVDRGVVAHERERRAKNRVLALVRAVRNG